MQHLYMLLHIACIITVHVHILTSLLGERGRLLLLECVKEHHLVADAHRVQLGDRLHRHLEVCRVQRYARWNAKKLSFFEIIKNQNMPALNG